MQHSPPLFLAVVFLAGVLGLVAVVAGFRVGPVATSRWIALLAVLPALGMLASFYSLAVHMHHSLGGWPARIGTRGFSSSLVTHADMVGRYFSILLAATVLAWPLAFVLCASIPRWRGALFYLGVYALSCFLCFGAMVLAPSQFVYWWWD